MQSTATLSLSETLVQNRLTAKAKSGTPKEPEAHEQRPLPNSSAGINPIDEQWPQVLALFFGKGPQTMKGGEPLA